MIPNMDRRSSIDGPRRPITCRTAICRMEPGTGGFKRPTTQSQGFWSPSWSVTIVAVPAAPALLSPPDDSQICERTPVLDWTPVSDAESYRVQVDDDPSSGSPALDVSTPDSNYMLETLEPGVYNWRVQAKNECGGGEWSAVFCFAVPAPPPAPTLLAPPNESHTQERTPSFSWSSVSGAASYHIQVDDVASLTPRSSTTRSTPHLICRRSACRMGPTCGGCRRSLSANVVIGASRGAVISNQAPIANEDRFEVDEDSPDHVLDVLANDRDPDGDPLRIVAITQPAHGSVSIAGTHALVYRPDPDYFGHDSLTYTVDDGYGGTDTARVELTVIGVNDPPVADAGRTSLF